MCIKREKKQHMWDKSEKHTSLSYIYIYIYILSIRHNVCKKLQNQKVQVVSTYTIHKKSHYIPQTN